MKKIKSRMFTSLPGPTLETGLGLGLSGKCLVAESVPMGPGQAQPEMAKWVQLPVGSPPAGRSRQSVASTIQTSEQTSGYRDMECHLVVWEVERYWVEIVRLTTTHNMGSGTLKGAGLSATLSCPEGAVAGWCGLTYGSAAPTMCWSLPGLPSRSSEGYLLVL